MREVNATQGSELFLGRCGENLASCVIFPVARWQRLYGEGTVQLIHQRNGDKQPYPCAVEQKDGVVIWNITSADVAVAGRGRAELQFFVGETLVKSETYTTVTERALSPAGDTPPAAHQGWVDSVLAAGAQAAESAAKTAQDVIATAQHREAAGASAQAAAASAKSAEEAREAIENLEVTAKELPKESQPTAEKQVSEDGSVKIEFGIPRLSELPIGGEAGEILMKRSAVDKDVCWSKDASGLSLEATKRIGVEKNGSLNCTKFVASATFSAYAIPDGYDRMRVKSMSIPARGGITVRFAACSYADGKLTVDAMLGEAVEAGGFADLTLAEAYEADSTLCLAAFADSADIGGLDLPGLAVNMPQFADNGVHAVGVGAEFAAVAQTDYMMLGFSDAVAYKSARSLGEIQAENDGRLTELEQKVANIGTQAAAVSPDDQEVPTGNYASTGYVDEKVGAKVSKSGDTMTGNLEISKGIPMLSFTVPGGEAYAEIKKNAGTDVDMGTNINDFASGGNYTQLNICHKDKALRLRVTENGVATGAYDIYHEGNKPTAEDTGAVAKTGDIMTGSLQMQPTGSVGYGKLYKNANADGDYGLQLQDVDPDGNFMGLTLSGKLQKLEFKKKKAGDSDYTYTKLYDEDNPPSAEEVGALSEDGGTVYGNVTVQTEHGRVTVKVADKHTTELVKNGGASEDYGTILRDTNGDAVAELKLSAANGNLKLKVGTSEYIFYHEGNIGDLVAGFESRIAELEAKYAALLNGNTTP